MFNLKSRLVLKSVLLLLSMSSVEWSFAGANDSGGRVYLGGRVLSNSVSTKPAAAQEGGTRASADGPLRISSSGTIRISSTVNPSEAAVTPKPSPGPQVSNASELALKSYLKRCATGSAMKPAPGSQPSEVKTEECRH